MRLAQIFGLKYDLKSEAAIIQDIMNDVKSAIISSYNTFVNGDKAKEPVLQMLADHGEPFSKGLVSAMEDIVANIDKYSHVQLFNRINTILGAIHAMKSDPDKKVRNMIHNSIRVTRQSEKNYREHVKSKFEMVISRLSYTLEKQAKILQKFLPKEIPLEGGAVEPQRKELSKQKLLDFSRTPAASRYGLTSLDVMEKVLFYPDLRQKLTTLINSIDRGHMPLDGPEVNQSVEDIMSNFKARAKEDNSALFGEEK